MSLISMLSGTWFEELATATQAIAAIPTPGGRPSIATVATIAVATELDKPAANDGGAWQVSIPPGTSPETIAKFRAASLALDASNLAKNLPEHPDADRCCWPHGQAMNSDEIAVIQTRQALFTGRGLPLEAAEVLADTLVQRDRASDDRRICLECRHLTGRGNGPRRCGNWQWARVAIRAKDAQLPSDFLHLPQRCDGFLDLLPTTRPAISDGRSSPFRDGAISSLKILGDKNDS